MIKKGQSLDFNQEYALESLWHEILHAKTKTIYSALGKKQAEAMETLNQFCARHTYPDFLKKLGGKATNQADIMEHGYGYGKWIKAFREDLRKNNIDESKAVQELMPALLSDYSNLESIMKDFIKQNKKK